MKNCFYLLICLLVLVGCRRDDDPTPDPCAELPARLDFTMSKRFLETADNDSRTKIDTLVPDSIFLTWDQIVFTAPEGYRQYEWQVGYDDRTWNTRTFGLIFSNPVEDLPVRLIVRDPIGVGAQCLPAGDTLTRVLNVVPRDQSQLVGQYRGVLVDYPQDTVQVDITYSQDPGIGYKLFGLNPGCDPSRFNGHGMVRGYRFGILAAKSPYDQCLAPFGWISLEENGQKIRIQYSIVNHVFTAERTPHVFLGHRVE